MGRIGYSRIPKAGVQARCPAPSCVTVLGSPSSLDTRAVPAAVRGAPSWKSACQFAFPRATLESNSLLETDFLERYEFLVETLSMGLIFRFSTNPFTSGCPPGLPANLPQLRHLSHAPGARHNTVV